MYIPHIKYLDDSGRTLVLGDLTLFGKDPQCHIQLEPTAPERQARIEKKGEKYILRDLRSLNGSFLNEAKILEAELQNGDIIRLGSNEFMFSTSAEASAGQFPLTSRNEVWHQELQLLGNVAKSEFPVLLLGQSGTGKDILAQKIHECSLRRRGPFLSVNCSALTETLIESELFGHIKGSFTGAMTDRKGAFEAARGGTLFLDEIGDLSYNLQAKLLRALENNEIRPVGSDRNVKTDVRIIAATHQNLADKIKEGAFRADLYFRLNVVAVTPPVLQNRMEDFESLLYAFAKKLKVRFSHNAILRLKKHPWPGNIRELKNVVAKAAALYPHIHITEEIAEKLIDKTFLSERDQQSTANIPVIKEIEKHMILKRLAANRGNQRRTALDLGMPKSTLHDRLKYYSIDPSQYRI